MFITFEGVEGSGKSTAMTRLGRWLEEAGHEVVYTREPGGSRLGVLLRGILLDARNSDIVPAAELFMYLADRAQHAATIIRPALERGAVVLSDRFADSTVVYQGYGRGLDIPALEELNRIAVDGVWPAMTLLFDVAPETGLARANARNKLEGKEVSEGRFEAESIAFHTRVRNGFLDWAAQHPDRFAVINGEETPDAVFAQTKTAVERLLANRIS